MQIIYIETAVTSLYLLYVQFSPQIGNIWWRGNHFSPLGAIEIIKYPLQESRMWSIEYWDVNYFMWVTIGILINISILQ